jgi:hypothetical protein
MPKGSAEEEKRAYRPSAGSHCSFVRLRCWLRAVRMSLCNHKARFGQVPQNRARQMRALVRSRPTVHLRHPLAATAPEAGDLTADGAVRRNRHQIKTTSSRAIPTPATPSRPGQVRYSSTSSVRVSQWIPGATNHAIFTTIHLSRCLRARAYCIASAIRDHRRLSDISKMT